MTDDTTEPTLEQAVVRLPRPLGRAPFITIEGIDGAGTSTQTRALARHLISGGRHVLETTEPGGTDIGALIRSIVLDNRNYIDPQAEALLFAADRAQHVNMTVLPALGRGITVVQDRYMDSSVAYQGAGRVLNPREIRDLSMWAASGLEPDLTILLDLDPDVAFARSTSRGGTLDRLENEDDDFRHRLRQGFLNIARRNAKRFLVIDGSPSIQEVSTDIARKVDRWFATRTA